MPKARQAFGLHLGHTNGLLKHIERHYGTDGCMVASSCFDCPLRCCVLEDANALREWQAAPVLAAEPNNTALARKLGVSPRTITRWRVRLQEVAP